MNFEPELSKEVLCQKFWQIWNISKQDITLCQPSFSSFVVLVLLSSIPLIQFWKKSRGASSWKAYVNGSSNERLIMVKQVESKPRRAPKGVRLFTHPPLATRFTVSINQEEATLSCQFFYGGRLHKWAWQVGHYGLHWFCVVHSKNQSYLQSRECL